MQTGTIERPSVERDALLQRWEAAKAALEDAKRNEMTLRKEVMATCFPDAKAGTNRIELANGWHLKAVRKINFKLESDLAIVRATGDAIARLGNEGPFLAERLLKWKVELSESEYKKLDVSSPSHAEAKRLIDSILTTSDGAPTIEFEPPKAKK